MTAKEHSDKRLMETEMNSRLDLIRSRASGLKDKELLKKIFSLIDLTTLDVTDNDARVLNYVNKVNGLNNRFPDLPNVAAICIYPVFIPLLKANLNQPNVKIASVAASFPSSQTFPDIRYREVERAVQEGADEIDMVISVGKFLEGNTNWVSEEIKTIKSITGTKHLKVILETGVLPGNDKIREASLLAMEAGADFIKTSTGKVEKGASSEAVYVMCEAIRDFHKQTGKMIGIKPAGGISDASTAVEYYLIVNEILGNDWIKPALFRFGASRLANNLLGEKYF